MGVGVVVEGVAVGLVADERPEAVVAGVLRGVAQQHIDSVPIVGLGAQVAAVGNLDCVPFCPRQVSSIGNAHEQG